MAKSKRKPAGPRWRYRSAVTGRYVSAAYAARHKATTVRERAACLKA